MKSFGPLLSLSLFFFAACGSNTGSKVSSDAGEPAAKTVVCNDLGDAGLHLEINPDLSASLKIGDEAALPLSCKAGSGEMERGSNGEPGGPGWLWDCSSESYSIRISSDPFSGWRIGRLFRGNEKVGAMICPFVF